MKSNSLFCVAIVLTLEGPKIDSPLRVVLEAVIRPGSFDDTFEDPQVFAYSSASPFHGPFLTKLRSTHIQRDIFGSVFEIAIRFDRLSGSMINISPLLDLEGL